MTTVQPANDVAWAARLNKSHTWHAIVSRRQGQLDTACGMTWRAAWMTQPRYTAVDCVMCLRRLAGRDRG